MCTRKYLGSRLGSWASALNLDMGEPARQWTRPRLPSGEFDVEAGTRRLLDILDEDRNGKVDAREIIDALHSHPDKEEIISLLRLHPDPEKALGIAGRDSEEQVAPVDGAGAPSGGGGRGARS